jgi:hypothetical protein
MMKTNRFMCLTLAVLATTALVSLATAQPMGPGGRGPGFGFGPGMMMGPGMMGGPGMQGFMCNPSAGGFSAWRIDAIEQAIRPDEAQKVKLEALKSASAQAADAMRAACPTEFPATPTARMDLMEKHAEAMLQAVKTVRPAFAAFYDSLNDEQKAKLNVSAPGADRYWHWRERW